MRQGSWQRQSRNPLFMWSVIWQKFDPDREKRDVAVIQSKSQMHYCMKPWHLRF